MIVAGALVGRFLDPVGVVPGALDYARIGPVAASGVEVPLAGDVSHDRGAGLFWWFRGKGRADGPADDADGAGELHPVGVDVSLGCGLADEPGDGPVRQQVAVDFLADHVRAPGPQHPSGPGPGPDPARPARPG